MTLQQEIIERFKSGDKNAFKEIFETFFNPLCAFGNKYINDHNEVEDLVQDVFVSFWERRRNFDHADTIKTFIYTSVRNNCLNHLKHQAVRHKHEDALIYELESDQFFTNQVIEEESFNPHYS